MAGRWKYSGHKTKAWPEGTHRRRKPELIQRRGDGWQWSRTHEVFENGRWEGFVNYSRFYKSKAEALRHRPKW